MTGGFGGFVRFRSGGPQISQLLFQDFVFRPQRLAGVVAGGQHFEPDQQGFFLSGKPGGELLLLSKLPVGILERFASVFGGRRFSGAGGQAIELVLQFQLFRLERLGPFGLQGKLTVGFDQCALGLEHRLPIRGWS